jgi:hypothetical protein
MNQVEQNRWRSLVLDAVLEAVAAHPPLTRQLVFKGARVLNLHLGCQARQSLDLDSNLAADFAAKVPNREEQAIRLEEELAHALRTFFLRQDPIRFQLVDIQVRPKLPRPHPRGWDALSVRLRIQDHTSPRVRGLPAVSIDIAAPETLLDGSTVVLDLGRGHINACALERIAGEKLRAYLSSLPAHRQKLGRPGDAIRAKDLFDIARIYQKMPLPTSRTFWQAVSVEFRVCCSSRYVDCVGLASFAEDLAVARCTYNADSTIPTDISFDEAWTRLAPVPASAACQHPRDRGTLPASAPPTVLCAALAQAARRKGSCCLSLPDRPDPMRKAARAVGAAGRDCRVLGAEAGWQGPAAVGADEAESDRESDSDSDSDPAAIPRRPAPLPRNRPSVSAAPEATNQRAAT